MVRNQRIHINELFQRLWSDRRSLVEESVYRAPDPDRPLRFSTRVAAPTKVVEIEVGSTIPSLERLDRYRSVLALVRLHGVPVGYLTLPVENGMCTNHVIAEALVERLEGPILEALLSDRLRKPLPPEGVEPGELLNWSSTKSGLDDFPLVTVCVTTKDRTDELAGCLDQLRRLDYPRLEFIVVDNAPSSDATRCLVEAQFSEMRYVVEERPGSSWGRNRGFAESRGEIIAFTDDDVRVDPGWVTALVRRFQEDPDTAVVTGLIVPFELETAAQVAVERSMGMGRGFRRVYCRVYPAGARRDRYHIQSYAFGTSANVAFRRRTFEKFGGFDPALGPGSAVGGGGEDPEIFFRVLEGGGLLVYEPQAIVFHRHRRTMAEAVRQVSGWVAGFSAYLALICGAYPRQSLWIAGYTVLWWCGLLRTVLSAALRPALHPPGFPVASARGALRGLLRLWRSRREARRREPGAPAGTLPKRGVPRPGFPWPRRWRAADLPTAIRTVDLTLPISALTDLTGYYDTLILVKARDRMLGRMLIRSLGRPLSAQHIRDEIARELGPRLLKLRSLIPQLASAEILNAIRERFVPVKADSVASSITESVSVIVPTRDRPDDLRRCLLSLARQDIANPFEIIVVDNNPESGRTPPVVSEFPGVRLIEESTPGSSAARNAGLVTARSEIVAMIDDDAVASETWLRHLIAPFARADVAAVCGNILPASLSLKAEKRFEYYGGLSRGFTRFEVGPEWFSQSLLRSVPTWEIGATGNCAVRRSVLADPDVGLLDEHLGPGTPSSACEDLYLYYRIAKVGHTIVYEPNAYVFQSHRATLPALWRQIHLLGRGQYAYQLNTLLRDGDFRALVQMLLAFPRLNLQRVLGLRKHPRSLILPEVLGAVVGPLAYALARIRGGRRTPMQLDQVAPGLDSQPGQPRENAKE